MSPGSESPTGDSLPRQVLSHGGRRITDATTTLSTPPHVCDARSARWRNRQGGVPENLVEYTAREAGALLRTGTRAFHRGPGRLQPHTEAGYISADGHPVALITLVRRGRNHPGFSGVVEAVAR